MTMIDCAQCEKRKLIPPGAAYEDTPCCTCRLSREDNSEKHNYIGLSKEKRDRLVSFFKRTEQVLHCKQRKTILYIMLAKPAITEREIAEELSIGRSKVSYHASIIRRTIPEIFGREYHL